MTISRSRLAMASFALILLLPSCTPPTSASPTLPSLAASAGASGLEAFCALDLETNTDVKAAIDSAQSAATGGTVDNATIATQVDAAVARIQGVNVTGDAATARDGLVTALNSFKANPTQTAATGVVSAHGAAVAAQTVACP